MLKFVLPGLVIGTSGLLYVLRPGPEDRAASAALTEVIQGELEVWVKFEGTLQSRDEQNIHSRLSQRSTITELAPEGAQVQSGDLLVAFDRHDLRREVFKLEEAFVLAEAEYESLVKAELPLQLAELQGRLSRLQADLISEAQFLKDSETLREKDLISDQELLRQQGEVDQLKELIADAEKRLALTRDYILPSTLRRGEATLKGARQQRDLATEQLAYCRLTAERTGAVVYQPLHIDGEYRTVKVGDSVYLNQRFMILADMSNLIVTCEIPEAQLSDVAVGSVCQVIPAACPTLRLPGTVERIGTMAHNLAGRPSWQKFFTVSIRLRQSDPRLRSGMSVYAQVRAQYRKNAVLAPRRLFSWEVGESYCRKQFGGELKKIAVLTRPGNSTHLEILDGLEPGDLITGL